MTTQHFADQNGVYIGGFGDGALPPDGAIAVTEPPHGNAIWNGNQWVEPAPAPSLSRAEFVTALSQIPTPPIFTEAEALAALEAFPPKFAAALSSKPMAYRAAAIEAWRTTASVARDAPLFLDLLAFYAAQAGLSDVQAEALGDAIFAGAGNG